MGGPDVLMFTPPRPIPGIVFGSNVGLLDFACNCKGLFVVAETNEKSINQSINQSVGQYN